MIAAAKPGGWIVVERRRLDPVRRATGARAVRDAVAHAARAQRAANTATTARGAACSSHAFTARGLADVDARGEVWTMRGGTDSAEWYVAALERALDVLPAEVFPPGFDRAPRSRKRASPAFAILSPISVTACGRKPCSEPPSGWQDAPMVTIGDLVRARADDPRVGLRFEDSSWTWAEVVEAAAQRAAFFRAHAPADAPFHVGVLLDNIPEFWFTLCGAALAGATVVGINPTRRGAELARDIAHTDCAFVLTETRAPRAVRRRRRRSYRPAACTSSTIRPWLEALAPFAGAPLPRGRARADRHVHVDLHVGDDRRAEGGAHGARAARGVRREARRDVRPRSRRRLLLGHAAVPLERGGRRLRERGRVGRDCGAAAPLLRDRLPARRPPTTA